MRWIERANKALPLNILNLLAQTCNAAGKDGYQAGGRRHKREGTAELVWRKKEKRKKKLLAR